MLLGRLHRTKGVFDLVDIWKLVVDQRRNAKLAIVGGDPTGKVIAELENRLSSNGIRNNVIFLGWLSTESISTVLKSSKVFVFPSHEGRVRQLRYARL